MIAWKLFQAVSKKLVTHLPYSADWLVPGTLCMAQPHDSCLSVLRAGSLASRATPQLNVHIFIYMMFVYKVIYMMFVYKVQFF